MHARIQGASLGDAGLRFVPFGGGRLLVSEIPANSWLVRFYPDNGLHYDRMIVVTVGGAGALHLAGWIGKPLTPAEWIAARDALFPDALAVRFQRLQPNGTLSCRELRLPAPLYR